MSSATFPRNRLLDSTLRTVDWRTALPTERRLSSRRIASLAATARDCRRFFTALAVFAALFVGSAVFAADQDDVRAADLRRISALINGDRAALDAVLDDTLTYGHADGRVQTKAELLAALSSGAVTYHSYDGPPPLVRTQGEVALLSGVAELQASARGMRVQLSLRYLAVYARRESGWRLVAYQSAQIDVAPASTR